MAGLLCVNTPERLLVLRLEGPIQLTINCKSQRSLWRVWGRLPSFVVYELRAKHIDQDRLTGTLKSAWQASEARFTTA